MISRKQAEAKRELYLKFLSLREAHPDWGYQALADALGCSRSTANNMGLYAEGERGVGSGRRTPIPNFEPEVPGPSFASTPTTSTGPAAANGVRQTFEINGNFAAAELVTPEDIRTVEQLMAYMEVDPQVWECKKLVCNKWDMGYKTEDGAGSKPLFQIKASFEKRVKELEIKGRLDSLISAFRDTLMVAAPKRWMNVAKPKRDGCLFELAIADLHFGKLCWGKETMGADWDTDIVEEEHDKAVDELLDKATGWGIAKFLLPIGNDFFHVDNAMNTTTAGTLQDVDTRWQKSFLQGRKMMVRTIEQLAQLAPVDVVMVRGNHDAERLYYLGETIHAWFHACPAVHVDNAPTCRKYYQFGKNLIGFAHGKDEGLERLPMLMATEAKEMFSTTDYWEWHLGHLHNKKKMLFYYGDEAHTVRARIIPSLCPPDAWHSLKGFKNRRSAEAYLWEPDGGIACEFSHSIL